uniref:Bardet-Biedl syndrome 7 protein homolog n=1 Tax=Spongospora subterranea TaxID=70186 RepID=A0A0H5QZN0_9EUKA|eukprot:CRZ07166.1 hypothetical protein [Spongospora subterranea]
MEITCTACVVGQMSSAVRNAAIALPSAQNKEQKIVTGDRAGIVACWRLKNPDEPLQKFKTKSGEREVTALTNGGPRLHKDKIYVAYGHDIVGLKKNGKEFFRLDTGLIEDIHTLVIDNANIWACSDYAVNRFENGVSKGFYICNDVVNHLAIEIDTVDNSTDVFALLACQDNCIRVIAGQDLVCEHIVAAPVTYIVPFPTPGSCSGSGNSVANEPQYGNLRRILFGTSRGQIGHALMGPGGQIVKLDFVIETKCEAVSTIAYADLNKSGQDDVIVGHNCGTVNIFSWENESSGGSHLFSVSSFKFQESVASLGIGYFTSTELPEVFVVTYSGSISLLRLKQQTLTPQPREGRSLSRPGLKQRASSGIGIFKPNTGTNNEIANLRSQLDELNKLLNLRRASYQTQSSELVAVETQFHVNHSFRLDPEIAAHVLSIEIEMPIDVIGFKATVPVMIMSSSAIIDLSPSDNKSCSLASFRCVDSCNRISITLRLLEGHTGEISLCIIPKLYPKTSQTVVIPVKPLSLHEKLPILPTTQFPLCSIEFKGAFNLSQIHSWIVTILPEMSSQIQSSGHIFYRNVYLGTYVICQYEKGLATFTSDNCSTISIVREAISKEATNSKVQFAISMKLTTGSIMSLVERIRPKLETYTELVKKQAKIHALKEIQTHEGEECFTFFSEEYCHILKEADHIQRELDAAPKHSDFLRHMLSDLFIDSHRLLGKSAQKSLENMQAALKDFDYDRILTAFQEII